MRLSRAEKLSSIDDLTGLYNSRFLAGALQRETKRALRTHRPLSVLFVDLDGFKGINDRWGHLSGSRALVEAAARIAVRRPRDRRRRALRRRRVRDRAARDAGRGRA